jgi:hypothetical protein
VDPPELLFQQAVVQHVEEKLLNPQLNEQQAAYGVEPQ